MPPEKPSDKDAPPSPRIEEIRDKLIPDAAFEDELATALNCSRRTVQRLNLPFVKVGPNRLYDLIGGREALRRHTRGT